MNKRIESFDILRCIAMIMIVALHVMGQGGIIEVVKIQSLFHKIPVLLLQYAFLCSVNVFMLISGFFGIQIKFRYSRIVLLYLQTIFWSITMTIIIHIIFPNYVNKIQLIKYIPLFTIYYCFLHHIL